MRETASSSWRRNPVMSNKVQLNAEELKIQHAINAFLRSQGSMAGSDSEAGHLDEDVITAFVEGNLSESEAGPVTSHLTDCSFCRHMSAELIRLDSAFAEESANYETQGNEPTRVGDVLSGILSRIFGNGESAVFAHEEKPEDEDDTKEES